MPASVRVFFYSKERHRRSFLLNKKIEIVVSNSCLPDKMPDLDRIFDRFYRAEQSRTTRDSYGIGLSIAQSIVQNHGGSIKATSKDGKSVTFTILL